MTNPAKYFLRYQAAWITDEARMRICEKGRQIGISYADSYDSVRKAAQVAGKDVWVMSRDEVQAKQYVLYCKRWAKVLKYACEDHGEQVFNLLDGKTVTVQVLTFASGAHIYALSSNPDAIVGKTGHVKLDEFALHKDQRQLFAVAKPVIQWGGTLSIISTHRGVGTVFNEIVQKIKEGRLTASSPQPSPPGEEREKSPSEKFAGSWSLHTIPIQRAVADGLVRKINETNGTKETDEEWLTRQRAECIDEEQWLQEYCCVPADEASAFLPYDLITGCEEANCLKDFDYLLDCKNPLYVGVDVARRKDLFVIDVGERVGDVVWDRLRLELQNKRFAEMEYELNRILTLPQVKRCCIDETGMGIQLAERAKERFGYKVEPVNFTGPVKEELAFALRAGFEDKRVRIARDDKLRADLRGIKKETTAAGNIRFVGESEDSHCDRFWAKALRQHAVGIRTAEFSSALI